MSPAVHAVLERLEDARQRWWINSLLCNVLLVALVSLGTFVLLILLDVLLQLSQAWLWILDVTWCALSVTLLVGLAYRVFRYQRTIEAAARRVELSFPDLGSHLINLIQLIHAASGVPEGFREAAIEEAATHVADVRFQQASLCQSRWQRWRLGLQTGRDLAEAGVACLLLIALTAVCSLAIPRWASSADRLFTPWRFVPQVGAIEILEVSPGDAEVMFGSRLEVRARIADPGERQPHATLYAAPAGDPQPLVRRMVADRDDNSFAFSFPAVTAPLTYQLQIGDSQSQVYRVGVRQPPRIEQIEVTYHYPDYLELPPLTIRQQHADLEAPQYTDAEIRIVCSTPLARGHARLPVRTCAGRLQGDSRTLLVRVPMDESAEYTIHLFNELGHGEAEPRVNHIRVSPDEPPTVRLVKPAREASIARGTPLTLALRAGDDHGLGEVRLEWMPADAENQNAPAVEQLYGWETLAGTTATTLAHTVAADEPALQTGGEVLVRAVAVDRRRLALEGAALGPQETAGQWHRMRLMDPAEAAAETLARWESVHERLWEVLQTQLRARLVAARLGGDQPPDDASDKAQHLRQQQIQVQTGAAELAASIDAERGQDEATLKQALARLAHGDMLLAAQLAESVARASPARQYAEHLPPLIETQDRIIESLRTLLELNRRTSAELLAGLEQRAGGDLPDDVQEKLEQVWDRLQEFLKQQKKVIEATKNLAKRPVEDFTEQEQQLLEELAAIEDEWSRFLEETHSDFSKLPEQDFADPSLLEELVEVQTELEMAADALTKKTADIAVPLEQLGAEMAEELVTNIEKWLPDSPDRERWSQEEPLTDEMKEAPMAELPGELEDLVGELMEDEEDLFDEMEDMSSSWADSLDAGAGWDAMDGPISNMSAKGVTGNRLPNSSEIGGRSGEGRQGKASGEFVADTAVGKGGRKTPSRLAPDPYVKGQVKDVSKDPVGGATGGGKESGVGGEGLEGPLPQHVQRDLQRMAQRQADLRNRAESIDLKFQVLNYHPTDLRRMIEAMQAVEADLQSGRYQNALRRKEVLLDGLGNIKTYLEGEVVVRRDQSANLPEDIQKELLGSLQQASPAGWEELNRRYFERLAGADESGGQRAESQAGGP